MRVHLNSFEKLEFDKVKGYIKKYSISEIGREHIENLQPSIDISYIKKNLSLVTEMKRLIETDDPLPIDNIADVRTSLHRSSIENFVLPAEELKKIGNLLKTSILIHTYFTRRAKSYPLLFEKVKSIYVEKILEYNINNAIDEDSKVRDNASRELKSIRKLIIEKNINLKKNLESILKSISGKEWTQDEIITTREGRMVIPVKVEFKNRVPGFIHSVSSSGATVYIEPSSTLELNNELRTLYIQEQNEIEKILKELTNQVREVREHIFSNLYILSELDFIQAKAKYSIEIIGSEPVIKDNGELILQNSYHPILLKKHKRDDIVPLNVRIPEATKTIVITGPNAGGKSVAMKTIGLLTLLAQSGCHISASPESEIRIFSDLFVDIGDEQSIENDLSSFSSHLNNLKYILENANSSSLVLLDEIGTGTDPNEGASLAAAILEQLTLIGSLTIATTHNGFLKAFAFETPHVENAAMEFDQNSLKPTFQFRLGIPGSSYAFEMAKRLNIPNDIIQRSKEFIGEETNKLENLIIDLENYTRELRLKLEAVNADKEKLDSLNIIYKNKITSLEKEVKAIKARALSEAKQIVEDANSIIEKSIKEIRESAAEKQTIKRSKDEIKQLNVKFDKMLEEVSSAPETYEFQIGDIVKFKESNAIGEVVTKLENNSYIVLTGDMRIKVSSKELIRINNQKSIKVTSSNTQPIVTEIKREIDLRGMYGDEAISAVDKFIDTAMLAGIHRVDIIHGKGTGALRKKIAEYLKTNSSVKSFRLGEWNEGGSGVTVVELI